jgi:hypothetical protein
MYVLYMFIVVQPSDCNGVGKDMFISAPCLDCEFIERISDLLSLQAAGWSASEGCPVYERVVHPTAWEYVTT